MKILKKIKKMLDNQWKFVIMKMEVRKMKKHNLLKAMSICFLVLIVISWIIPVGTYSSGTFTQGETAPLGIVDLVRYPLICIATFIQYGLVFLVIGGFYGVLNKTGVYSKFVEKVADKFKGKETKFLVISMILFALLASLTALSLQLFILVPFFIAVILLLGYDKITALASTVGAILVGLVGSTYGFNVSGYINNFLGLDVHQDVFAKVILFLIVTVLLIFFVLGRAQLTTTKVNKVDKKDKKDKKKEEKGKTKDSKKEEAVVLVSDRSIPYYEKSEDTKKSSWPMIIVALLTLVLLLVGTYNWYYGFGVTFFQDTYTSLMEAEVGGYPIFANLLGNFTQPGYWNNYELCVGLVFASLLIGWIYSVKMSDVVDGFIVGAKKMLPTAFLVMLASTLFTVMLNSSSGTFVTTINNQLFSMSEDVNIPILTVVSAVTGFFYNDFYYFLSSVTDFITTNYEAVNYSVIGLLFQGIYGLLMMVLPTSIVLVAGLHYLNVSWKEWFQYIWKLLLQIFVLILIVVFILFLFL